MKLLIKIEEPHSTETLVLDHVRPEYIFKWEEKFNAFIFRPKDQAEVDTIFSAQRFYRNLWAFVPLIVDDEGEAIGATVPKTPSVEPALRAELAEKDRLLTSALKRIDVLKAEGEAVRAAALKLKAEYDKVAAVALAASEKPEPAEPPVRVKAAKPHWKTLEKQAKASAAAQPTATDDDIPTE